MESNPYEVYYSTWDYWYVCVSRRYVARWIYWLYNPEGYHLIATFKYQKKNKIIATKLILIFYKPLNNSTVTSTKVRCDNDDFYTRLGAFEPLREIHNSSPACNGWHKTDPYSHRSHTYSIIVVIVIIIIVVVVVLVVVIVVDIECFLIIIYTLSVSMLLYECIESRWWGESIYRRCWLESLREIRFLSLGSLDMPTSFDHTLWIEPIIYSYHMYNKYNICFGHAQYCVLYM